MVDMTILNRIQKDTKLYEAFLKVMRKKKLGRLFEFALTDDDPTTAFWDFVQNHTAVENKFSKGMLSKILGAHEKLLEKQRQKMRKQDPTYETEGTDKELEEKYDALITMVNESSEWKRAYKIMIIGLKTRIATFAKDEFPHTPEYAAYVRAAAERDARKLAADLELERQVDEFLGLTVAVGQGDNNAINRLSRQLSQRHAPRRGKKFKPADIVKKIKTKLASKFI